MTRAVATPDVGRGRRGSDEALYPAVRRFEVRRMERYGPGESGAEGSVKRANFTLGGHDLISFDSPVKHGFTFTPAISIFVDCENTDALETVFKQLSEDGQSLMPLDNDGFSTRFGWLNDRFRVSWQLNLK